jgi:hypothetical protein
MKGKIGNKPREKPGKTAHRKASRADLTGLITSWAAIAFLEPGNSELP